MTMNIMSVSVPSSSQPGSSAMGKNTATSASSAHGSAGLFSDVFSQESASQSSFSAKDSATPQDAQAQLDADVSTQRDAESNIESAAEHNIDSSKATAQQQVPTESDGSTAEEQRSDGMINTPSAWVMPDLALNKSAAIESVEAEVDQQLAADEASKKITLSSKLDADADAKKEAKSEAPIRQGGSGLPPELGTPLTQTAANAELVAKSSLAADKAVIEHATKETTVTKEATTAKEEAVKAAADTMAKVGILNNTHARVTEFGNTVVQVNDKTAQILAEYADIKVQTQAGEQDAKAEQNTRSANLAPDSAARTAAPEWLAQIEHGKRWPQTPSKADALAADTDELSLVLSEKTSAARAINAALNKSALANTESTDTVNLSVANGASGLSQAGLAQDTADTQTNGQDASALLANRENTLLAATPERTAMLDKALTLHGSAEQNAKQLAQQAQVVVSQNLQEAEIKLNPSEFGAMRIQIRIEQGEVQVQFVASHPQARDLLEQAMPRLRDMLQQQGMNLHQGQQQSGQQQAGQQSAQQQANASMLSQGLGQDNAGNTESGSQQDGQTAAENANTEWRSYSANGDEVQEQVLNSSQRALYGADGAKIDFFA